MQITADIINKPVKVLADVDNSVAKGAGFLALIAAGSMKTFDEPKKYLRYVAQYQPNPANREVYDSGMETYKAIYSALKDIFFRLNAFVFMDSKRTISRAAKEFQRYFQDYFLRYRT